MRNLNIVRRTSMSQLEECGIEAGHPSLGRVSLSQAQVRGPWGHWHCELGTVCW